MGSFVLDSHKTNQRAELFELWFDYDMLALVKSAILKLGAPFSSNLTDINHSNPPRNEISLRSQVMLSRNIAALSLLILGTTAMADNLDLNLRNSAAQVQYATSMGRDSLGKTELHFGALYSDSDNQHNTLGDIGIVVKDDVGSSAPGWSVGAGIKGLGAHTQSTNESAVAIGGLIKYSPPGLPRLGIVGQLYFAPNITTFGDANRYVEEEFQLEYSIVSNTAAYLGYRNIQFNLNSTSSNATVDEGAFIGVRLTF
jgi:YfaZ precursor